MILKKKKSSFKQAKKIITFFRTLVLTRHPSHSPLRKQLRLCKGRSVVRLGSTTSLNDGKVRTEVNSVQGVKNSASKLLMKRCFNRAGVKTAEWFVIGDASNQLLLDIAINVGYPIVAKSHFGSRGVGNTKLDTQQAFQSWMQGKTLSNYIFEKFQPLGREYRLHISKFGCFYACRKLLKSDAPENTWQYHDDVVTWALESNPSFKKPNNWDSIVADCVKAQEALGLDICAFDVMVSLPNKENNSDWLIVESASAPSFGNITLQKYLEEIPKIINSKNGR
jgi:D-alanine-D-alanine ligase-like ATP-grasp enzyme